jgi:hypothetical protein
MMCVSQKQLNYDLKLLLDTRKRIERKQTDSVVLKELGRSEIEIYQKG